MKKLIFLLLIFVGCEKDHECKVCQTVMVMDDNSVIRQKPFTACGKDIEIFDNMVIRIDAAEGPGYKYGGYISTTTCK